MKRCAWAIHSEIEQDYHDEEWGLPVHDDQALFEMLTLESAQSGLSWHTILRKRAGYRDAFADFEIAKVARFTDKKIAKLLENPNIVRNKLKVESTINNAKRILEVQKEFGSFDQYIWSFVDGQPIQNCWKQVEEVPASTDLSLQMSKSLKKKGFQFIGPTTCYAFMQATGMVNDHLTSCFRYQPIKKQNAK